MEAGKNGDGQEFSPHVAESVCMLVLEEARKLARLRLVEEHVRFENLHDLDGVVKTFGNTAVYDDEPWEEHHDGLDGVRGYYHQLMTALPDLSIEVMKR